jgi:hypothetical protein
MEKSCIFFVARTEFLNIILTSLSFKGLKNAKIHIISYSQHHICSACYQFQIYSIFWNVKCYVNSKKCTIRSYHLILTYNGWHILFLAYVSVNCLVTMSVMHLYVTKMSWTLMTKLLKFTHTCYFAFTSHTSSCTQNLRASPYALLGCMESENQERNTHLAIVNIFD